ncbi:MAG: hypothetical protein LBL23_05810, partial [Coriobacteriales bacterium]|nr:hypothetical protein [Coriobacteriales bacterium]
MEEQLKGLEFALNLGSCNACTNECYGEKDITNSGDGSGNGNNSNNPQLWAWNGLWTSIPVNTNIDTNGLTVDNTNHTMAINAPYCADFQKTVWKKDADDTSSHFECIYTTDRIIRGNETGYVNDLNNGLTITDNNDGSTTISITDTGIFLGTFANNGPTHYGNAFNGTPDGNNTAVDDSNGTSSTTFQLPVFTVNAQGQITAIQAQTITKARLSDDLTSGLTLIGDGSVATPYSYSINLTTNGGLVKGGPTQLGTTDQLELKSCPAGYVLASKGQGQGYDCFHIDELEDVNQSYEAGTSLDLVASYVECDSEHTTSLCQKPCPVDPGLYPNGCYVSGGTFNVKYDAAKGLTITADGDTGKLAANLGAGLTFDNDGKIELNFDGDSGLIIDDGKVKINAPICTPTSTAPTATGTDKSGRLTWTGTAFDCQRVTDSTAGTYGSVTAGTISMPIITVNAYGEIALSRTSITSGNGINIDSTGQISIKLNGASLAADSNGLKLNYNGTCTGAGQGLSYSSGTISCTAQAYWNLTTNSSSTGPVS